MVYWIRGTKSMIATLIANLIYCTECGAPHLSAAVASVPAKGAREGVSFCHRLCSGAAGGTGEPC